VYHKVKKLKKGNYLLFVTTYVAGQLGRFILRAYSDKKFELKEVDVWPSSSTSSSISFPHLSLQSSMDPSSHIVLRDEWSRTTAGGAFNFQQWRKNPQYFLHAKRRVRRISFHVDESIRAYASVAM